MKLFRDQSFLIGLFLALLLAFFFPSIFGKDGILPGDQLSMVGVAIIFIMQGMFLSLQKLTDGRKPQRLLTFVLVWNFFCFPLTVFVTIWILGDLITPEIRSSLWMLSILPTTVSSAVVFSHLSGGSVPHALFASVLSNLLATVIVPFLGGVYLMHQGSFDLSIFPLLKKVFFLIVLPLLLGQLLRKILHNRVNRLAPFQKTINNLIILFIVHLSFANSISTAAFTELTLFSFVIILLVVLILLILNSCFVWWSSGHLHIPINQRISAFFCASQKSIVTGMPLISSLYLAAGEMSQAAIAVIPLLCYHPAQLLLASVVSHYHNDKLQKSSPQRPSNS